MKLLVPLLLSLLSLLAPARCISLDQLFPYGLQFGDSPLLPGTYTAGGGEDGTNCIEKLPTCPELAAAVTCLATYHLAENIFDGIEMDDVIDFQVGKMRPPPRFNCPCH